MDIVSYSLSKNPKLRKKISILGDSISTFNGYSKCLYPYYWGNNNDVLNKDMTWWGIVAKKLGMTIECNNSVGGALVSGVATIAGNVRANDLGTNPDVILIYMGVNDFNTATTSTDFHLGTYTGDTVFVENVWTFSTAYATMLNKVFTTYPNAKVFCMTLISTEGYMTDNGDGTFTPTYANTDADGNTLEKYNKVIRGVARHFGAEIIETSECGITDYNASEHFADYDATTKYHIHPNARGMQKIANKVIEKLKLAIL